MAKYKYANEGNTAVNDTEKGIYGIHPGVHLWAEVDKWVKAGNTIEPFKTADELKVEKENGKLSELKKVKEKYKDTEGVLVDGVKFDTDTAARIAYLELFVMFLQNPSYVVTDWKASEGVWVTINKEIFDRLVVTLQARMTSLFSFVRNKEEEVKKSTNASNVSVEYTGV